MSDKFEGFLPPEPPDHHPWQQLAESILLAAGYVAQIMYPNSQYLPDSPKASVRRVSPESAPPAAPLTRHERRTMHRDIRALTGKETLYIPHDWQP